MRLPRPLVSRPVAIKSLDKALPTPNAGRRRPPDSTSMVAHALAVSTGSRSPMLATFMPNLSFLLPPANAAITLITSRLGAFSIMRSLCQIESMPPLSQRFTQFQKPLPSSNVKFAIPIPAPTVIPFPKFCYVFF